MKQKSVFLKSIFILLLSLVVNNDAYGDDKKILMFINQYKALTVEAEDLWKKINNVDMTKDAMLDDLSNQTLNAVKRINSFSEGIQAYSIDQRSRGTMYTNDAHKILMLANTSEAMSQTLGVGLNYLMMKKGIYLQTAIKYRDIWMFIERETGIR